LLAQALAHAGQAGDQFRERTRDLNARSTAERKRLGSVGHFIVHRQMSVGGLLVRLRRTRRA
jgi:hypothetical protein